MALDDLYKPRLCELGKIKIGRKADEVRKTKSGDDWRAPQKLDHFIVTTLNRDGRGDLVQDAGLMEELTAEYGDRDGKLRQLPIYLLSNEIEDSIQGAWLYYNGKRLGAKADGVEVTWYCDPAGRRWLDVPLVALWMATEKDKATFKKHTTFNCVIASKSGRWGGVYKFRTTSVISGDQLYGSLVHVKQLTGGVLRGIPLRLVVRPMQVAPDGKPTTVHVVHVELRGADLHEIQQRALEQKRYELAHAVEIADADRKFKKLLNAPGDLETEIETADVSEEFHPEAAGVEPLRSYGPDPLFEEVLPDAVEVKVDENGEVVE